MIIIKIRPHHLLDIIRDYGNKVEKEPHNFGASLKKVADDILSDIDQTIRLVANVDSICITCSKLKNNICLAEINNELLMRDYNDKLDSSLFDVMKLSPNTEIKVRSFLKIVNNNISSVLSQFTIPSNNPEVRKTGTIIALVKLKIRKVEQIIPLNRLIAGR